MSTISIDRSRRPHRTRTRTRLQLEALEERYLLSGISGETIYPVPGATGACPQIVSAPDGNLWFTEWQSNKVGMINAATGTISQFTPPSANSQPYAITSGPDGNVWFTEAGTGKIASINPAAHAITEYAIPTANSNPRGITAGPDGNIWFTESFQDKVGVVNLTTHAVTEFATPANSVSWAITSGPDGNIWFTEWSANRIGIINPTTHAISDFPVENGSFSRPYSITTGPDGKLWFTDTAPAMVGSIDPATHAVSEYPLPVAGSIPFGVTSGPDGNLWFMETATASIGRISPTTGAVVEFPIAGLSGSVAGAGIATGPDGNLWFGYGTNVGVATLAGTETDLVVTQQPPSGVTAGSPFGLTVAAEDGSGNVLSSFNGTVTVALANNPSGATLGGTLTATATNGVATFAGLTLTKAAAGYTLVTSSGLAGEGFTSAITVTPAAASQLVILQQPPGTVKMNSAFGLQAAIEDPYGNVVTSANNAIAVALASNPGGATLGGTTTMTAVNGVVTFSNLTLNKRGTGYTLRLSGAGLSSATTSAFAVK